MSLHAFLEYLKYKWKAKNRHGVHSPFVYDLIAHVLLNKGPIDHAYLVEYPSLPLKYENLISRIAARYKHKAIHRLPLKKEAIHTPTHAGLLIFNEQDPNGWPGIMNEYFYLVSNESAVVVTGIHKTPEHTVAWNALCKDARVKMSIDVYGIGLLFFKPEFKEQQHFVLKY